MCFPGLFTGNRILRNKISLTLSRLPQLNTIWLFYEWNSCRCTFLSIALFGGHLLVLHMLHSRWVSRAFWLLWNLLCPSYVVQIVAWDLSCNPHRNYHQVHSEEHKCRTSIISGYLTGLAPLQHLLPQMFLTGAIDLPLFERRLGSLKLPDTN